MLRILVSRILVAITLTLGLASGASAHGTYDVSATSQGKIISITGSADYVISGTASVDGNVLRTYKSSFGDGSSDYSNLFGIEAADAGNMQVGDYIWLDNRAYGEVGGLWGGASSGNELDAVFSIINNSQTESLFITIEYTNSWSLDTGSHDPFDASGIAWLNFHSHGAVSDSGSYNVVNTSDGSNSFTTTFTREFATGVGGGAHGVTMHFYQNVSGAATVPEAGSLTLAGVALAGGFVVIVRRRRKA